MAEPTDIYDEVASRPEPRPAAERDSIDAQQLTIVVDLPVSPPVSASELDVVERFFADILDAVLGDDGSAPALLRHKFSP